MTDPIRELLQAVLDTIDIPLSTPNYDRHLYLSVTRALVAGRAAIEGDPATIPSHVDHLRAKLAEEADRG